MGQLQIHPAEVSSEDDGHAQHEARSEEGEKGTRAHPRVPRENARRRARQQEDDGVGRPLEQALDPADPSSRARRAGLADAHASREAGPRVRARARAR